MCSVRVIRQANQVQYVEPQENHSFSRHYLRNRSTSDIGVLGYIGVFYLKEHSPEFWLIPPGLPVYINGI